MKGQAGASSLARELDTLPWRLTCAAVHVCEGQIVHGSPSVSVYSDNLSPIKISSRSD